MKGLVAQSRVTQPLSAEQMQHTFGQALTQLISAELLYQAAASPPPADLEQRVAEMYDRNRARFSSEADYLEDLQAMAMTEQEFKEAMRREIVVNSFIEREFAAKVAVTEAEAMDFYRDSSLRASTKYCTRDSMSSLRSLSLGRQTFITLSLKKRSPRNFPSFTILGRSW